MTVSFEKYCSLHPSERELSSSENDDDGDDDDEEFFEGMYIVMLDLHQWAPFLEWVPFSNNYHPRIL